MTNRTHIFNFAGTSINFDGGFEITISASGENMMLFHDNSATNVFGKLTTIRAETAPLTDGQWLSEASNA